MRFAMTKFSGMVIIIAMAVSLFADETMVGGWKIIAGNDGKIKQMVFDDPSTYLNIEQQFQFEINAQNMIQSGTVKFKDGVERAMGDKEAQSYFDGQKGEHSIWEYYLSHGKTVSYTPAGGIPESCFGKKVRVFTMNDVELFGKLMKSSDPTELFLLERDNACCGPIHCSTNGVREVQALK